MQIEITPKNNKKIGSLLAQVRESEKVKQFALAKRMKTHQPNLSQIEHNSKVPALSTIVTYLDKLGYRLLIAKKEK